MILLTDKDEFAAAVLKHKLSMWEKLYSVDMADVVGRIEV
jgi:hypothetical protein